MQDFQKIWTIRNTGTCTWDEGYTLVYIGGSNRDLTLITFNSKKPAILSLQAKRINIGINLTAPCKPGKYEGHWRMRNDQRLLFWNTVICVY